MPVTQQDIDRINAEITTAERQVSTGGDTVIYRSVSDLIRARDDMVAQYRLQNGNTRPRRINLVYGGRGY